MVCPLNQKYRGSLPECQTCANFDKCSEVALFPKCGCENGTVIRSDGRCVAKSQCPCESGGHYYPPGHVKKIGCHSYRCVNRAWVVDSKDPCPSKSHTA